MYTGNTRSFGGSDILFHGPVDRFCFIDIEAWEEDSGGIFHQISKYLYQVSDKALEAAERGQVSGIPDDNAQAGAGALALFGFVTKFVAGSSPSSRTRTTSSPTAPSASPARRSSR
ncbi:hypothetical protein [Streptomyces sp. WAC01526]|uniref:hypothetical protein n=1 Tax=Streptomyces sp. WAC01526 TaxID=2588709 RepID=UPI0011DF988E|nr:hypothetical protein [Streptomyces sp. WAC01526]